MQAVAISSKKCVICLTFYSIMKRYSQAFFLAQAFLFSSYIFGQNSGVTLIQDSLITKAFELKIQANKEVYEQYEFRIQLYYGGNEKAQEIMASVRKLDPDLNLDLSFETPNYKVQVGPFKKRAEANVQLQRLKNYYREAFLLEPKIR